VRAGRAFMYTSGRSLHITGSAVWRRACVHRRAQLQVRLLVSAEDARGAAKARAAARRANHRAPPASTALPPTLAHFAARVPSPSPVIAPRANNAVVAPAIAPLPVLSGAGRELVLSPPALVVTREMEWGNILVGFEQANKYTIRAAPGGQVVGFIAEEDGIGKSIARNILRTHRSFKATVLDKNGDAVFVIRRPFYVFSTHLFVDEPSGINLGKVEMQWHLWRRRYALFTDKEQFAQVDSGFLAIDFDMRDGNDKRIASVNKDFTGVCCVAATYPFRG
jgi:uncharacterized protein YxjI